MIKLNLCICLYQYVVLLVILGPFCCFSTNQYRFIDTTVTIYRVYSKTFRKKGQFSTCQGVLVKSLLLSNLINGYAENADFHIFMHNVLPLDRRVCSRSGMFQAVFPCGGQ